MAAGAGALVVAGQPAVVHLDQEDEVQGGVQLYQDPLVGRLQAQCHQSVEQSGDVAGILLRGVAEHTIRTRCGEGSVVACRPVVNAAVHRVVEAGKDAARSATDQSVVHCVSWTRWFRG